MFVWRVWIGEVWSPCSPALTCWAIFGRPYGTRVSLRLDSLPGTAVPGYTLCRPCGTKTEEREGPHTVASLWDS